MSNHSQPSHLRVLFESALQDYESQTHTTLASHPLAVRIQSCDSVESITSVLQDQARALGEFRRVNNSVAKSLENIVSVLYTVSVTSTLSEAIGLVRQKTLMVVCMTLTDYYAASSACKCRVRWLRYPALCMGFPLIATGLFL
jgi:hypothetical protein